MPPLVLDPVLGGGVWGIFSIFVLVPVSVMFFHMCMGVTMACERNKPTSRPVNKEYDSMFMTKGYGLPFPYAMHMCLEMYHMLYIT